MMVTNLKIEPVVGDFFFFNNQLFKVERKTKNSRGDRYLHSKGEKFLVDQCELAGFSEKDISEECSFIEFINENDLEILDAMKLMSLADNDDAKNAVKVAIANAIEDKKQKAWALLPRAIKDKFIGKTAA